MRVHRHLTYANVMATIAVFGVLAGGGAYAASKIGTADIANKAVTAKKLDSRAVKSAKLAGGAVKNGKLAVGAVEADNLSIDIAGLPIAGASVGNSGDVVGWFNRVGDAPPSVGHSETGVYGLDFPGLGEFASPVVASATLGKVGAADDPDGEISAAFGSTASGGGNNFARVYTSDSSGTPENSDFSIVLYLARSSNP